jgi:hypothetical protein
MKSEKWRIERQADECMDGWMDLQRGKGRERWIARQQDPRDRCRHDRMEGWIDKETDRGGERKGDGGRGQRERERERVQAPVRIRSTRRALLKPLGKRPPFRHTHASRSSYGTFVIMTVSTPACFGLGIQGCRSGVWQGEEIQLNSRRERQGGGGGGNATVRRNEETHLPMPRPSVCALTCPASRTIFESLRGHVFADALVDQAR